MKRQQLRTFMLRGSSVRALLLSDSTSSHLSRCFWHMALLTRSTAQSGAIVMASVYRCIPQVCISAIC